MVSREVHTFPEDCPVVFLDAAEAFSGLPPTARRYAHHLALAAFHGAKICLFQTSWESPGIFALLLATFGAEHDTSEYEKKAAQAGVSAADFRAALVYTAAIFGNYGNYKSFGDSKIIPAIERDTFEAILKASSGFGETEAKLWETVADPMFSLTPENASLGFRPNGRTTYYSANCTKEDAEAAQTVLTANDVQAYNTRIFKTEKDGKTTLDVHVASARSDIAPVVLQDGDASKPQVRLVYGDFAPLMQRVVNELQEALAHVANDNQKHMLEKYIESFSSGSVQDHVEGSRHWIKDKGPLVESYIGFIETYRDPLGARAEWEGFAAVVNKEVSKKFERLVSDAEKLLPLLPWPKEFERVFRAPDFTSLDVLGFGSSGVPAGINIPNYDSVRENDGFKNVSLGNMLRAYLFTPPGEYITFLRDEDQELYRNTVSASFDVQVGLHELLGHGSGKLFMQNKDGSFNFQDVISPVSKEPITSWYMPGENWDSKFPGIGSSYEECRAECVGLYLCYQPLVHDIYNLEGDRAQEVAYVNWLHMVRAGVLALEYFKPGKGSAGWGQAHMMARYAILRVLLEADEGLVTLARGQKDQAGGKGTTIAVDRSKIASVGMPAIGAFLAKLQVFKSTADFEGGKAMYEKYTSVDDDMLSLRDEVIHNRKPRRLVVQHATRLDADGQVELLSFPATLSGMIQSMAARYPLHDKVMADMWKQETLVMQ